jgi:hypothetical protein
MRGEGEVLVRDLGSTNGTRINGRRVAAGRLRPGDELAIADLRYCVADPPGERPAGGRQDDSWGTSARTHG